VLRGRGDLFRKYSRTPLFRKPVIRITRNPDRLGPSGKYVENSTKLTSLEITDNRIKYSTVLWLLELQIRRSKGLDAGTVHTVNSNSRTSNYQCSLLSKKNPIFRIFCIYGWLAFRIMPVKWSSVKTRQ